MYHIRDGVGKVHDGLTYLGDGDAAGGAIVVTTEVLKIAKEAAGTIPVPGLGLVFELLYDILEKAQTSQANRKALEDLREELGRLYMHLENVKGKVESRMKQFGAESSERRELEGGLPSAMPLISRIELLKEDLEKAHIRSASLLHSSWLSRWFFSDADADVLKELRSQISKARNRFQFDGVMNIEILVEDILNKLLGEADKRALEQLSPGIDASYLAAINEVKSHYLGGTRKELFEDLNAWIIGSNPEWRSKPVMFLRGEAGIGKSTVATELCRQLQMKKALGASFFFTRGAQKLDSTELFFPTIAVQLANLQPSLRPYIVAAAHRYLQTGRILRMQYAYEELLEKPLSALPTTHPPFVIVVDALDECTQQASLLVPEFLGYLMNGAKSFGTTMRILILSRPELHYVRDVLDAEPYKDSVLTISLSNPRYALSAHRDIRALIQKRLHANEWSKRWAASRGAFDVITKLTERSNGVFVYAETAMSFLLNDRNNLDERFELLLSAEKPIGLSDLDALYLTVLETAFPKKDRLPSELSRMQKVLGYIAVMREQGGGFTPRALQYLTGMSLEGSMSILNKLRSVVHFELDNPDSRFRVVHLTFREFLLGDNSPEPFHVVPSEAHAQLSIHCMTILLLYVKIPGWKPSAELKICQESSRRHPGSDRPFPFHVWYAVTHLEEHRRLSRSSREEREEDRQIVMRYEIMTESNSDSLEYWLSRRLGAASHDLF
ncbi:hypothetical protein C8Q80DRAFT_1273274 [Daedaleopsis nitida]|nr:hypothetical protein C8Q80DRAFT_1273274 [Daedaleopsis nitida]